MINDLQILDRRLVICSQLWYIDYVVYLGPEETFSIVFFGVWINKGLKTRPYHIIIIKLSSFVYLFVLDLHLTVKSHNQKVVLSDWVYTRVVKFR